MECYEIGSVVRSARIRHGMTQEDLAFGICAVSTLSKIERGICSPKIGTFEALMERMGELPGRCILLVGEQELQLSANTGRNCTGNPAWESYASGAAAGVVPGTFRG